MNKLFDKLYKFLAVIAVGAIAAQFIYLFISRYSKSAWWISLLLPIVCIGFGYLIQSIFSRITKTKRRVDSSSYETSTKLFSPKYAVLSCIFAVISGFIGKNVMDRILYTNSINGVGANYDAFSVYPYMALFAITGLIICGIVLWFYPYNRIISIKSFFSCTAIFAICFALYIMFGVKSQNLLAFCFAIYAICTFIILNQSYIIKIFDNSMNSTLTPSSRFYNIGLIIILILAILIIILGIASVLTGIVVLLNIFLYSLLSSMFNRSDVPVEAQEVAKSFEESIFGKDSSPGTASTKFLFALFCILVISLIIYLIFGKGRKSLKSIGVLLIKILNAIFNFFISIFVSREKKVKKYTLYIDNPDYKDEEIDLNKNPKSKFDNTISNIKTYKDFLYQLNSCKTTNEKLQYAYLMLINQFKIMNFSIVKSDTPREISEKVLSKSQVNEIIQITSTFECYKYTQNIVSVSEANTALNSMCLIIQKYYS